MGWTKEQEQVIAARDCSLLVSAAAGSGKTAVLVERIITRLTEGEHPLDVDQLLVVTFTEAAAAEMKERIRTAIEQKLESDPDNLHLQRQATLIHHAKITTIHSFCLSVIRDYFHAIDLEPGFRTLEEGERKLLMQEVMEALLEEEYEKADSVFTDFVEMASTGRDDRKVEELILELYEFSRSNPDPEAWLMESIRGYQDAVQKNWDTLPFVETAMDHARASLEEMERELHYGLEICRQADGPAAYEDTIVSDIELIRSLKEQQTFQKMQEQISGLSFARLAANRDPSVSEEKAKTVKALRDQVKKEIQALSGQFFYETLEELREDMAQAEPFAKELVRLTIAFGKAFEEKKQNTGVIDFGDMEQYALRILKKEEIAEEYRKKYEEIMIDEYQDSNLIQETLLMQISRISHGQYNVFMVGDVKQSIYRFRLSRPELFMEKYASYQTEGEGQERRIDLHKNFRSRREVLDAVNYLFYQIMTKALGKVEYDEQAALYAGAQFEEKPGFDTEVLLIEEGSSLEAKELEARAVAARIKELIKRTEILDKETGTYRRASYRDIVILLRSLKGWTDVFSKVLNEEGIPTFCGTREGYFQTREISLLLDYLKILDNEKQDLPLTAVLKSCFGGLTSEELARIRCAHPEGPFYQAAAEYAKETKEEKLCAFYERLHQFRERVPYTAIHELLEEIVSKTGYRDYVLAMPGGIQRRANLDMLIEKAKAYESTSYKGLFHFLRYVEQLQKYQVDYGEANTSDEMADTVRLMSIHKSKGLEFPIVIVSGTGKKFNTQDIQRKVVIHQDLGIGVDAVYLKERMQAPSFLKKLIQNETRLENLGEELRVLYVALTRAKEKLIITGTMKSIEEKQKHFERVRTQKERRLSFGMLQKAGSYLDFLIPALIRLDRTDPDTRRPPICVETLTEEEVLMESVMEEERIQIHREDIESIDPEQVHDAELGEHLKQSVLFEYPYEYQSRWSRNFSVSELKRAAYEPETVEEGVRLFEKPEKEIIPKFRKGETKVQGAARGTAYHRILELLDFARTYTEEELEKEIQRLVQEEKIDERSAEAVDRGDLLKFLQSECALRMQKAAKEGRLKKEQPFVLGVEAGRIYTGHPEEPGGELLIVQGIIDLFFEEDGEIVLLDYKTDRVRTGEELVSRYHLQLDYYQEALEKTLGKRVKEKLIYSFALGREIRV